MKRINHFSFSNILLSCLFCSLLPLTAFAQEEDATSRLKKFFNNMATYSSNYTQEKVYLHLDNNGYFPDEKVWFKAYVFNAGSLLPSDLSRVLYVELLTPSGEIYDRKILPIYNGRTYGNFNLAPTVQSGFYEVRAYTRAMLNWDLAYAYSRVIPVFDVPKDTTQFSSLRLLANQPDEKLKDLRSQPSPIVIPEDKKARYLINFYPEGGHIISGAATKVAYKTTDQYGRPISVPVTIYASDGQVVANTSATHEGMGSFILPETWRGGYAQLTDDKNKVVQKELPRVDERGCQLTVTPANDGGLTLNARPAPTFGNRTVGVSIMCRGVACYFDTLHLSTSPVTKTIPRKDLRDGIHQITLFTPEGEILGERLSWVAPHAKPMVFKVEQNEKAYQPFSPIVLNFNLADSEGKPQRGEFSLSVQDIGGMVAPDAAGLKTDMLLCSDLKGYIHNPEYYFESDDETHRNNLDLLLCVQGFRRYEWKEMAGVTPFELKQPAEDGQIIDGIVRSKNGTPMPGMNINMTMVRDASFTGGTTQTDSLGNFAIKLGEELYGDALTYFTITNSKDARQKCKFILNRNFYPAPQPYEPAALIVEQPQKLRQTTAERPVTTFAWTDTIPKIHYLPEARVKAKDKSSPYGSRYTYLGGENAARNIGDVYYNVEDEMQKLYDKGEDEPLLWDWLAKRNPYFRYEVENHPDGVRYVLFYHEYNVELLLDNQVPIMNDNLFLGNDVRSLVICTRPEIINRFGVNASRRVGNGSAIDSGYSSSTRPTMLFLLYSELGPAMLSSQKKGSRGTVIHGYSKAEEFYSPNYRMEAHPDQHDARRTLYWTPALETDDQGKASVIFYSNFRTPSQIHINAQGITATGALFQTVE